MNKTSAPPPSLSSPPPAPPLPAKPKVLVDPSVRCCNCQYWKASDGTELGLCSEFNPMKLIKSAIKMTHREYGCVQFKAHQEVVQAKKMIV